MSMLSLLKPFQQHTCPACGASFYPGECAIYSTTMSGKVLEQPKQGLLSRLNVPPLVGAKYTYEHARRCCPNPECNYLFPYNIERTRNYTIAIIGDVNAGKSHYIASCIDQLTRHAQQVLGCSKIVGLDDTDERFRETFYTPIYVRKQQILQTPQAKEKKNPPLVYELTFAKGAASHVDGTLNLLFYDASGEDFAQTTRMVQYSPYVAFASAIIFLVDPMTMPGIVNELPSYLRPAQVRESSTAVFNRVLQTFRSTRGLAQNARISTPVAIALSKSDVLKYPLKRNRQTPRFLQYENYTNAIDPTMYTDIDREVRELLQTYNETALLHASEDYENASFFALSATGASPDSTGHFGEVRPLRCLDPLLWALWKIGIIQSV
ncbi:hypothetical protein ccbrp13_04480 [Ktedonobacteria bacterium brp13]|nr:hypothetical protein ccbrp13_04480 [Ktedonobacteria bacterium brp13]